MFVKNITIDNKIITKVHAGLQALMSPYWATIVTFRKRSAYCKQKSPLSGANFLIQNKDSALAFGTLLVIWDCRELKCDLRRWQGFDTINLSNTYIFYKTC